MKRSRTRLELVSDEMQTALYDLALEQCEERNPHTVYLIVAETNRLRRSIQQLTRLTERD
jgi:hypothetical protein